MNQTIDPRARKGMEGKKKKRPEKNAVQSSLQRKKGEKMREGLGAHKTRRPLKPITSPKKGIPTET